MVRLTYISRSRVPRGEECGAFAAIVRAGEARNARIGVRAALVQSRDWFAQLIEGEAAAVDLLMASILCDSRHDGVRILARQTPVRAALPPMPMVPAYCGDARHVQARLDACLLAPESRDARSALNRMILDMADAAALARC